VFAQKKNLFKLDFLIMLRDILKFHKQADENYELAQSKQWNLSDMIQHRKYSKSFVDWYLIPMTGAIWSMTYKDVLNFPAATFMQFCINHRLLQVDNRPIWRTIKNGSINYVNAIAERLNDVRLNHKIERITNQNNKLELFWANGSEQFDQVVFATSAPIAYELLKTNLPDTAKFIAKAKTSANKIILHQDESSMPSNRNVWSSWNVKSSEKSQITHPIELTYYINKLQPLPTDENYFVTLNSDSNFNSEIFKTTYHHPQFDNEMITLQNNLPLAQGFHGIYFAGAWTRYGFHEDGILSAVKVAELLGVKPPWKT
jgi:predicted NAD/FAD-binding protein